MSRSIRFASLALALAGVASMARAQPAPARTDAPGATPAIEGHRALRPFFEALARTRDAGTIARVTHLGDSSIGLDDLPHRLRGIYQSRYGDAGPGFVLLQASSGSYANRLLWLRTEAEWDLCFIIHRCARDGRYGLGGVTVTSSGGAISEIVLRPGRRISRAELWYAAHPGGGRIAFRFGRGEAAYERLATRADVLEDRWHAIRREPGQHTVRVSADGGGIARAYGVVLEGEGPGVVWDSISMVGAFTPRMLASDEAHFAGQLAHRDPALVVLSFGGNDLRRLIGGVVDEPRFTGETAEVLSRVRRAVPNAACLLLGITDHAQSGTATVERHHVETIVRAQRAAAARAGCAFWSSLEAMGGAGSFEEWQRLGLASTDGKHLSPRGREVIARRLVAALDHAEGASRASR
ncbi:MAG: hypothetical protein KF729_02505 [Sandaracinaceae bacterium]|nr:hypothetical protein [Sandaracinaceae bacterium]